MMPGPGGGWEVFLGTASMILSGAVLWPVKGAGAAN